MSSTESPDPVRTDGRRQQHRTARHDYDVRNHARLMMDRTTSTVAMAFAVVGVIATLGWDALAWYGIRTQQDVRDAV